MHKYDIYFDNKMIKKNIYYSQDSIYKSTQKYVFN